MTTHRWEAMKVVRLIIAVVGGIATAYFGFCFFILMASGITEYDTLAMSNAVVLPGFAVSLTLVLMLHALGWRSAALAMLGVAALGALCVLVAGHTALVDLVLMRNRVYPGHQNNDYTSLQVLPLVVLPTVMVIIAEVVRRQMGRGRTRGVEGPQ